jgi:hypothetical protein
MAFSGSCRTNDISFNLSFYEGKVLLMSFNKLFSFSMFFFVGVLHAEVFVNSMSCPSGSQTLEVLNRRDPVTGGLTITTVKREVFETLIEAAEKARLTQLDAAMNQEGSRYKKICRVTLMSNGYWSGTIAEADLLSPSYVLCVK